MADQPQTPNAARISAMLQDLAAQKSGTPVPQSSAPLQASAPAPAPRIPPPPSAAPQSAPPANLPTAPAARTPVGTIPPPRPLAPPPAPREATISVTPLPTPPPPPQPPAPIAPVAPIPIAVPVMPLQPPMQAQVSSELRTMSADIGNLRVGQAPQGIHAPVATVTPGASPSPVQPTSPPVMPVMPPVTPPVIMAPPSSGTGGLRKLIYLILGLIILGGIAYSLVSLLGGTGPTAEPSDTPSPSVEPSPTLVGKSLRSYFGTPTTTVSIAGASSATSDIRNGLTSSQPSARVASTIGVTSSDTPVSAGAFLGYAVDSVPPALTAILGTDWALLSYGQTEQFDAAGMKSDAGTTVPKAVIAIEVSDASGANQAMRSWELAGLASASEQILGHDTTKMIVPGFTEGVYQTIPVRYWNFPYADSSVDYAIVTASNNKNYLIISASRESMFFAIDQLIK